MCGVTPRTEAESALLEVPLSSRPVGTIIMCEPMVELPVLDSHRFRILHPLDRGGISRVYVAYDEELNRMAMAPEDRYVSAIDLGDDIACWLAKRPVTARPTTASRDRVADPAIWSGQKKSCNRTSHARLYLYEVGNERGNFLSRSHAGTAPHPRRRHATRLPSHLPGLRKHGCEASIFEGRA